MTRGKVIVIEGLDGSGKKTQTDLLVKRMEDAGINLIQVSFPFYENESSILAKKYLQGDYKNQYHTDNQIFVRQMSAFYAVDRVSSFIEEIYEGKSLIQHMNEGTHIICDRYTTSNILHQSGNLRDREDVHDYVQWIQKLEYHHLGLPKPDLVFYLDVLPEISVENIKTRYNGEEKEDVLENINHLNKVYERREQVIQQCGWKQLNCCPRGKQESIEWIHEFLIYELKKSSGMEIFQDI